MNKEKTNKALITAAILNFIAALLHIAVIFGGADWYRFFGAGEAMAQMAAQGDIQPVLITLFIATMLTMWGLYALSGAQIITRLPYLKACLLLISAVYCIRGVYGFFLPYISDHPDVQSMSINFWFWSSAICLIFGITHVIGIRKSWQFIAYKK